MTRKLLLTAFALLACLLSGVSAVAQEAYACCTPSKTMLTFYYDDNRAVRPGTTYDLNTGDQEPGWHSDSTFLSVTQVVFDPSFAAARPTTTHSWFLDMQNLQTITGMKEYLNTSQVTDMSWMFADCSRLTSLDVSKFNTANVTDMSYMFCYCRGLTSLGMSNFNTANVTDMTAMFYWCRGLNDLDVSNFNTANVTDMTSMFYYCDSLKSLDVSNFNTANVTSMRLMFGQCREVTSLNVSGFITDKVTDMVSMFLHCGSLRNLDVSSFNTKNVTNMTFMFEYCEALTSLDLGSFNTANVTDMHCMFSQCRKLKTIYVTSGWSTAAVTSHDGMFDGCTSLVGGQGTTYSAYHVDKAYAHIDGGPSNPGYLTATAEPYAQFSWADNMLAFYYDTNRGSRPGISLDLNTGNEVPAWQNDTIEVETTRVVFDPSFADARPTTTYSWFYDMVNLQTITGLEYLNTSKVTNMSFMFWRCSGLKSLDVSHFNTSRVTTMYGMFALCTGLTSLDVSSFNTAKVTDMGAMFWCCSGLKSLDVSNFNTANVTSMLGMFESCNGLTSLDLSNFNTSQVTNMEAMFLYSDGLLNLDLSNWNTENVTNMYSMFCGCSSLTSLDLSSFSTTNVTSMWDLFDGCSNLRTIYVGVGWNTSALTSSNDMFGQCTSLVGGMGTTYDVNHIDSEYAHIDGGPANPGYFTPYAEAVAYACFTESDSTLTFYYDNQWPYRPGTTYGMNTGNNTPDWTNETIYFMTNHVVFDPSFADARPTSTHAWFSDFVQSIEGMEYLNTSEVTDMSNMFVFVGIDSIDVSHFNTDKVTNMLGMFAFMPVTSLDLSNWNTENVTNMYGMFYGCQNLTTIKVGSGWSTEAVTTSEDMFKYCASLVGGQGTTFDEIHLDKAYAHIDGGPSNPGYFTAGLQSGDVNGDGQVNITDATVLINALLNENFSAVNQNAADLNEDGLVNITDATLLINRLLNSR